MSKGNANPGALGAPTQDAVARQLEHFSTFDATELREIWPEHCGSRPPPRMRRDMLARILAHELQNYAYGGLSKSVVKALDQVARGEFGESNRQRTPKANLRLTPGTRLVRDWHGITHEVCVTEEGFSWGGTTYGSLSAIARAITGTRWNGLAFFGLRSKGGS